MSTDNLEDIIAKSGQFRDKKILLHVCCAVCAGYVSAELKKAFGKVVLYFYNPNVQPAEEYGKRLEAARTAAANNGLELLEGDYDAENWLAAVKGLEGEPEGGKRCDVCFARRLEETARLAAANGFDCFAATLTVSPHKNSDLINVIGEAAGKKYGVEFLAADFKKKDGFKKSMDLAKAGRIYRQHYCGCAFSLKEASDRAR